MSNTITAYFKGRVGVAESVYQNDYGIVMAFDSIDLPAHFDCYFSRLNQEEALPGLGADNRVTIPNSILANPGNVTIHIPLHTGEDDSEVEYVIYFKVIGRARPIDDGTPAQMTAIERALALLSQPITNIEEIVNEALSFTGDTFAEMQEKLDDDMDDFKAEVRGDITDVEQDFSILQGQFDTAVAALTVDSEVANVRVGDDGVSYLTAGTAVRTQFADVKADIKDIIEDTTNTAVSQVESNVELTLTAGFLNLNGTIDSSTAYKYSNKISVKPNDKIEYYLNGSKSYMRAIVAYVGGTAVAAKGVSSSNGISSYIVPDGVCEIAFDFTNALSGGTIRIIRDTHTYIQQFDKRLAQFFSESDATLYQTADGYRLLKNGFCEANADYKMLKYSVPANTFIHVKSVDVFQFQNGYSVPTSGTNPRLGGVTYEAGEYYLITPSSTNYVIVSVPVADSNKHCFKMHAVIANENDTWEV